MHYAKCYGELVLIPDKGDEPYKFNGGMGQMYTESQLHVLDMHIERLREQRRGGDWLPLGSW